MLNLRLASICGRHRIGIVFAAQLVFRTLGSKRSNLIRSTPTALPRNATRFGSLLAPKSHFGSLPGTARPRALASPHPRRRDQLERSLGVEAPVIEGAACDGAFEAGILGGQQVVDVLQRCEASRGDDGNAHGPRQSDRRRQVQALEDAVAIDVGVDDGRHARVFEAARQIEGRQFGRLGPAFDRDLAALGVDTHRDPARKRRTGFAHQRGIAHRHSPQDDPCDAFGEPRLDRGEIADAAAELRGDSDSPENGLDGGCVLGFARKGAVEIDPIELRLADRKYQTTLLKGVFGALRDAGPDHWGRLIINRHHNRELSELGYLLNSADDRAGALGFGTGTSPPAPRKTFNQTLQLEELQQIADELVRDKKPRGDKAEQADKLLLINTLMGGARPKAVVEDAQGLWIAKFSRPDQDRWNAARVERSMLLLAKACGISVAESKLATVGDRDVLLLKRFDRDKAGDGYHRHRMVSALTILRADEIDPGRWSYVALAEELRRISQQARKDAAELFRRMCFNALVSNLDDHPRNHALLATDAWKLSPAYDITPQSPVGIDRRDLAMICGSAGTYANVNNLLSQCERFLLEREEAEAIILEMQETVGKSWRKVARAQGVTAADCEAIRGAFVYPGFAYALDGA